MNVSLAACSTLVAVVIALLAGCSTPAQPRRATPPVPWASPPKLPAAVPATARDEAVAKPATSLREPGAAPRDATSDTEFLASAAAERPAPPALAPVASASAERIQLNLQNVDVRALVDAVLGDTLKVTYTVAPQVQGKVTLRTARPLTAEELLLALESALASVSAALVVQGAEYGVIPIDALPTRVRQAHRQQLGERSVPGHAIQIVQLRFANAVELQRLLDVTAPKGAVLQADPALNQIVIAGSGVDRAMLLRTIEALDVDSMQGMTFAFFRLQHVAADQLINDLRQVFRAQGELIGNRVRLISMERMRTVIAVASRRADLEWLETWVRRLDSAPAATERRLFVHHVQHGSAAELAETLHFVLTGEASVARPTRSSRANTGAQADGTAANLSMQQALTPQPAQGPAAPAAAVRGPGPRIVANEDNNSLVILGTEAEYRLVREAMVQLDQPARQVLIEAVIAEVALNDDLRFGVQWFFDTASSQSTFTDLANGAVISQFPGFSYLRAFSPNARLVINALQARTDVKVLSAPRLAVLNNRRAHLTVGDEVPTLSQTSQGTLAPGAPIVSTIQMRDTGVMLEVVPRISEGGNVILEVTQEVSDVTPTTTSGIDSPTIQRRRLRSTIATRDGATVALGGLIREQQSFNRFGVPILKDLPLVGTLFRTDDVSTRRTELIVLMVPRVMRNDEDARITLDALLSGFRSASELMQEGVKVPLKITD